MAKNKVVWGAIAAFLVIAFILPVVAYLIGARGRPPADLVIVYTEDTRSVAKALQEYFEKNLRLSAELVPASDVRVEFRAYPVVVVENPQAVYARGLGNLVRFVTSSDGRRVPILAYDALLGLAASLASRLNATKPFDLRYTGTLYIVSYDDPATKPTMIAKMLTQLATTLEGLFAVRFPVGSFVVVNVSAARAEGIPVDKLRLLPAIVVKSRVNLTEGSMWVVDLGGGYYTLAEPIVRQLLQYFQSLGVIRGFMVRAEPPDTSSLIRIGNESAPVKLVVYWDFLCPYSARFANTTFPKLVEYAEKGLVTLYIADLLIHPEAYKLHSMEHCVYEKYGVEELLEYIREAFRAPELLAENKQNETLKDFMVKLEKEFNVTGCNAPPAEGDGRRIGVTGTPTVVIWGGRVPKGWLVMIPGALPPVVYQEEIDWALGTPVYTLR